MGKRQIINRLLGFGQRAIGPYANRIRKSAYARHIGRGTDCFYIISAVIGDNEFRPDMVSICFNKTPDASCLDFTFKMDGAPVYDTSFPNFSGDCARWVITSSESEGIGPEMVITADYTPGTCRADGEAPGECDLAQQIDYPVDNNVYGPSYARIGDIDDATVEIGFPVAPAVAGDTWRVEVNGNPVGFASISIVGDTVRIVLSIPVGDSDVLTLSQSGGLGTECVSSDGRICWAFTEKPITNNTG